MKYVYVRREVFLCSRVCDVSALFYMQVDKLMIAKQHGCYDVIHCDESRQYKFNLIIITLNFLYK